MYWTKEQAIATLRKLYGENGSFRSQYQERAILQMISGISQQLTVLRTGGGKSLLHVLPFQLPGAGTTVVILPLVSLRQDMVYRCHEMGIEYKVWDITERDNFNCPLVFVSVEQAVGYVFRTYIHRLDAANALDHVVFDECHLVITAFSYRPSLRLIKELQILRYQFVYLTATLQLTIEGTLFDTLYYRILT